MSEIHERFSHTYLYFTRFEVLVVVTLWITVLWNVTACSVVDIYLPTIQLLLMKNCCIILRNVF